MLEEPANKSQILLYQSEDGRQRIEVHLDNETVWLSQKGMAELFQTTPQNINIHLKNIFSEGEVSQDSVIKESLITASDGKKYRTQLFRLEAIIAVGYRVSSHRGIQFRQWATERLKEYIVKGFTLDDDRLSNPGGLLTLMNFWTVFERFEHRRNISIKKYGISTPLENQARCFS